MRLCGRRRGRGCRASRRAAFTALALLVIGGCVRQAPHQRPMQREASEIVACSEDTLWELSESCGGSDVAPTAWWPTFPMSGTERMCVDPRRAAVWRGAAPELRVSDPRCSPGIAQLAMATVEVDERGYVITILNADGMGACLMRSRHAFGLAFMELAMDPEYAPPLPIGSSGIQRWGVDHETDVVVTSPDGDYFGVSRAASYGPWVPGDFDVRDGLDVVYWREMSDYRALHMLHVGREHSIDRSARVDVSDCGVPRASVAFDITDDGAPELITLEDCIVEGTEEDPDSNRTETRLVVRAFVGTRPGTHVLDRPVDVEGWPWISVFPATRGSIPRVVVGSQSMVAYEVTRGATGLELARACLRAASAPYPRN